MLILVIMIVFLRSARLLLEIHLVDGDGSQFSLVHGFLLSVWFRIHCCIVFPFHWFFDRGQLFAGAVHAVCVRLPVGSFIVLFIYLYFSEQIFTEFISAFLDVFVLFAVLFVSWLLPFAVVVQFTRGVPRVYQPQCSEVFHQVLHPGAAQHFPVFHTVFDHVYIQWDVLIFRCFHALHQRTLMRRLRLQFSKALSPSFSSSSFPILLMMTMLMTVFRIFVVLFTTSFSNPVGFTVFEVPFTLPFPCCPARFSRPCWSPSFLARMKPSMASGAATEAYAAMARLRGFRWFSRAGRC